ncbi:DUF6438 domain-containing protein [Sphingomonas sp.]|uniref:DUF6438 domain-containing protein n=1 Tax=Sphingomonas sp. TaxID=28214 RepID=UPI0031D5747F
MRRLVAVMLLGLAVAGCRGIIPERGGASPGAAPAPAPVRGEAITYEAGPCFGRCPVYSFTVSPDGRGRFTGRNFTAVVGERSFELTAAQYDAFAAALAPYRPARGTTRRYAHGEPGCEQAATDMPSAEVSWRAGETTTLHYYFGCDREANQAMADAIGNAPDLIPALAPLIGARP